MGTRNSTLVKLGGEIKVAQYGQWDGYPTGQGATIQKFLREVDLDDFKKKVENVRAANEHDIEKVNATPGWKQKYPFLSRDAGAEVLNYIRDGEVEFLVLDKEFRNDGLFCEYWYELDLDKETITMNGKTFTFEQWKEDGFMEELEKGEEE